MVKVRSFLRNESGATAIEYAIIAGGISIAIVVAALGIGTKLNTTFTIIDSAFK